MRREWAWMLLLVLLAAAVRWYRLGYQSLWIDEVITYISSIGSFWHVLTQTQINNQTPPFYFAIVHAFMALGHDEFVLRLPSMLAGAASIVVFYRIVRAWGDVQAALVSAAILAISPLHVWYSQEARQYALLLLLSLLALWFLQRSIRQPESRWSQAAFVLAAAGTFYCHTVALPFIAFLAAYALLFTPRSRWKRWLRVFAAIGALLLPGVLYLMLMPPIVWSGPRRAFSPLDIAYLFWAFATGYSVGPSTFDLHQAERIHTVLRNLPIILPLAMLFAALAIAGAMALWRRCRAQFWIVVLWIALPLVFATAGALLTRNAFNVRYVIVSLPAFDLVVAMGACASRRRWVRSAALAMVVLASAWSLRNYFFNASYQREDNRAAGAYLAAAASAGDLVIANATFTAIALHYYLQRPDVTILAYPPGGNAGELAAAGLTRAELLAEQPPSRAGAEADLRAIVARRTRFWIYLSRAFEGASGAGVLSYCDRHFRRVRVLSTENGVRLLLCEPASQSRTSDSRSITPASGNGASVASDAGEGRLSSRDATPGA